MSTAQAFSLNSQNSSLNYAFFPHFIDDEAEAQRNEVSCLRTHSKSPRNFWTGSTQGTTLPTKGCRVKPQDRKDPATIQACFQTPWELTLDRLGKSTQRPSRAKHSGCFLDGFVFFVFVTGKKETQLPKSRIFQCNVDLINTSRGVNTATDMPERDHKPERMCWKASEQCTRGQKHH